MFQKIAPRPHQVKASLRWSPEPFSSGAKPRMKSTIKKIIPQNGKKRSVGYIRDPDGGADIPFFDDCMAEGTVTMLRESEVVTFEIVEAPPLRSDGPRGRVAKQVRPVAPRSDQFVERAHGNVALPPHALISGVTDVLQHAATATDWRSFESETHFVLRLLGVHNLYRYDCADQKGKPDGFFQLGHLVVIYDCTLETGYLRRKAEQIKNYVAALAPDKTITVSYPGPDGGAVEEVFATADRQRQVWIITNGSGLSRIVRIDRKVAVKEVPLAILRALAAERLVADKMDEADLCVRLESL